jgi:hypothetical protein
MRHEISQGVFYDQACSSCPINDDVLYAVTSLVCNEHAGTSEIVYSQHVQMNTFSMYSKPAHSALQTS